MSCVNIKNRNNGKTVLEIPVDADAGAKTEDLYRALNAAAAPQVILLHAAKDSKDNIYSKTRIRSGVYYVTLIPSYAEGMDPLTMISMKRAYNKLKSMNREHDANTLSTLVAKELYHLSPQSFEKLAERALAKQQEAHFWEGVPKNQKEIEQLSRLLQGTNHKRAVPLQLTAAQMRKAKTILRHNQ